MKQIQKREPESQSLELGGITKVMATMAQVAQYRPRDEEAAFQKAMALLDRSPEFAERAWYSIPYAGREGKVNVEGPSIKAALALVQEWGNSIALSTIHEEREESAKVGGIFYDAERNLFIGKDLIVSRWRKIKDSDQRVLMPIEQWQNAMNAASSKALRNAICNGISEDRIERFVGRAKEVVKRKSKVSAKPMEDRVRSCLAAFLKLGVSRKDLDRVLDLEGKAWTEDDVLRAGGIFNAIQAGEASVKEIFGLDAPLSSQVAGAPSVGQAMEGAKVS